MAINGPCTFDRPFATVICSVMSGCLGTRLVLNVLCDSTLSEDFVRIALRLRLWIRLPDDQACDWRQPRLPFDVSVTATVDFSPLAKFLSLFKNLRGMLYWTELRFHQELVLFPRR